MHHVSISLMAAVCAFPLQSRYSTLLKTIYVNPDNVEDLASFLHQSASIDKGNRLIYFGSGKDGDKLLEIPIGRICEENVVAITVGLVSEYWNTDEDRDPRIGIADESGRYNLVKIYDVNNYVTAPPCHMSTGKDDNIRVSEGTPVPAIFKFILNPAHRYGSCETGQEGGYLNTGRFNVQTDITTPLRFHIKRHGGHEDYYFRYFLIEVYKN